MKFGLRYCNTGPYVHAAAATELVQAGEAAGFDTAWTIEHTVVPANYKSPYPYSPSGKMAGGVDDLDLPDPLIWMAASPDLPPKLVYLGAIGFLA